MHRATSQHDQLTGSKDLSRAQALPAKGYQSLVRLENHPTYRRLGAESATSVNVLLSDVALRYFQNQENWIQLRESHITASGNFPGSWTVGVLKGYWYEIRASTSPSQPIQLWINTVSSQQRKHKT